MGSLFPDGTLVLGPNGLGDGAIRTSGDGVNDGLINTTGSGGLPLNFTTNDTGGDTGVLGTQNSQSLWQQQQAAAEAQRQNAARESFNLGRGNTYSSATDSANMFKNTQRNNILDFIDSTRQQQQGIDRGRVKAQIGKNQAGAGILGMINRGVRSGMNMLGNKNAGDSSAALAIAQAYGDIGSREQADVNNQFALENEDYNLQQQNLGTSVNSAKRRFGTEKQSSIDQIVGDARNAFASLNDAAAGAGISDRIAIEQEKEAIRQQTLQQLAELDSVLGGVDNVNAMGGDTVRSEATRMMNEGRGAGSQYSFTDQAPVAMPGASIGMGSLPIYSNRRRRG